jgi:electron transport complex protein RnfE
MEKSKSRLSDGLVRQNIVLMSATAIAPVAACAVDFNTALALSVGFTIIAFISVFLCRFVPKKIVYTIRVIIYALIASLAFIPSYLTVEYFYGSAVAQSLGIFLPILVVNPLILTKTETRFCLRPLGYMLVELAGYVTGFNFACISIGILRDILANKSIGGLEFDLGFTVPAVSTTFGGLIISGIAAGFFRWQYNLSKERKAKKEETKRRHQEVLEQL